MAQAKQKPAGDGKGVQDDLPHALAASMPLRAAGFIVTLYGDVVAPRGGEVWMGSIIAACARVGISETLVRTAVSRLVAAGQLAGQRVGRRSFYRLTPQAMAEFDAAAALIYARAPEPRWRFVWLPDGAGPTAPEARNAPSTPEASMAALERSGHARLKPQLALGTDAGPLPPGALGFAAQPQGDATTLRAFAAAHFDLAAHARAYDAFITRFNRFTQARAVPDTGEDALALRLLLVDDYRRALLRDPRLPPDALPADWAGHHAARVFAGAYLALSPLADAHVARAWENSTVPLTAQPETLADRHAALQRLALGEHRRKASQNQP